MSLFQELCLSVAAMADPKCKNPRGRLTEIKAALDGGSIDKLRLAQACLEEVGRETLSEGRRAAWRKQTRKLAKELRRRGR